MTWWSPTFAERSRAAYFVLREFVYRRSGRNRLKSDERQPAGFGRVRLELTGGLTLPAHDCAHLVILTLKKIEAQHINREHFSGFQFFDSTGAVTFSLLVFVRRCGIVTDQAVEEIYE